MKIRISEQIGNCQIEYWSSTADGISIHLEDSIEIVIRNGEEDHVVRIQKNADSMTP